MHTHNTSVYRIYYKKILFESEMMNSQRRHVDSNLLSCQWPVHQIRDSFVELHIVFVCDADGNLEDANVPSRTGSIICLRKKNMLYTLIFERCALLTSRSSHTKYVDGSRTGTVGSSNELWVVFLIDKPSAVEVPAEILKPILDSLSEVISSSILSGMLGQVLAAISRCAELNLCLFERVEGSLMVAALRRELIVNKSLIDVRYSFCGVSSSASLDIISVSASESESYTGPGTRKLCRPRSIRSILFSFLSRISRFRATSLFVFVSYDVFLFA